MQRAEAALDGITPGWTFQRRGGQNQNGDYVESILLDADGEVLTYDLPDRIGEFIADAPERERELLAEVRRVERISEAKDARIAELARIADALRAKVDAVRALCDDKSVGPLYEHVVRRALDGES